MRRDDVLNIPAGVGMDILIADQVVHTERKTGKQIGFHAEGYEDSTFWNLDGHWDITPPPFSTDISAAWEVVEKIEHAFQLFVSGVKPHPYVSANFIVGDVHYTASAGTAALAICRAALLVVMDS